MTPAHTEPFSLLCRLAHLPEPAAASGLGFHPYGRRLSTAGRPLNSRCSESLTPALMWLRVTTDFLVQGTFLTMGKSNKLAQSEVIDPSVLSALPCFIPPECPALRSPLIPFLLHGFQDAVICFHLPNPTLPLGLP